MSKKLDIEKSCTKLAEARTRLAEKLTAMQSDMDQVRRTHQAEIRRAMSAVQAATAKLHALVEAHPEEFEKPRTQVYAGIKVGFQAGKERIDIPDPQATVDLIRKLLPEQADSLIVVEEKPVRAALAQLPQKTMRKLRVELVAGQDAVVIRPQDGDLEALAKSLVGEDR